MSVPQLSEYSLHDGASAFVVGLRPLLSSGFMGLTIGSVRPGSSRYAQGGLVFANDH
jgi:hypothetical protein